MEKILYKKITIDQNLKLDIKYWAYDKKKIYLAAFDKDGKQASRISLETTSSYADDLYAEDNLEAIERMSNSLEKAIQKYPNVNLKDEYLKK